MVLFFFVRREGKCEKNYKKKEKKVFLLSGSFLTIFGRLFLEKDD